MAAPRRLLLASRILFVLSGLLARVMGMIRVSMGERQVSLHTFVYTSWFTPLASPIA